MNKQNKKWLFFYRLKGKKLDILLFDLIIGYPEFSLMSLMVIEGSLSH